MPKRRSEARTHGFEARFKYNFGYFWVFTKFWWFCVIFEFFTQFWWVMVIFGFFTKFLPFYAFMVIFVHFSVFTHFWLFLVVFGHFWSFLPFCSTRGKLRRDVRTDARKMQRIEPGDLAKNSVETLVHTSITAIEPVAIISTLMTFFSCY